MNNNKSNIHKDCSLTQGERLARLKRLHATALGLYMAARILGRDGEVQKRRLERIASELSKYDINCD